MHTHRAAKHCCVDGFIYAHDRAPEEDATLNLNATDARWQGKQEGIVITAIKGRQKRVI